MSSSSSIFPKCLCPRCFEEVYLGECKIISGKTPGKVLYTPKGPFVRMNVKPLTGPIYTLELAHRECTNQRCHYLLPYNIESVPSITLAVVGDTFSGKTNYIAALIHQIKTAWKATGLARFMCLTPDVEKDYLKNFNLTTQQTIQATIPGMLPDPIIYKLVRGPSNRQPATVLNLVIYDVAGEDFYTENLVRFGSFVLNTDALIFVANPCAIPHITDKFPRPLPAELENEIRLAQAQKSPAIHLNETIEIIERYHDLPDGARLHETPIAVMLAKSDLLEKMQPPPANYEFFQHSDHKDKVEMSDVNQVSEEVKHFLSICDQEELISATSRFRRVRFFATSAIKKYSTGGVGRVQPRRCLDPFLWILHELGAIGAN